MYQCFPANLHGFIQCKLKRSRFAAVSIMLLLVVASLHAQTEIGGGIYAHTTWQKAQSPYEVTSDVVVFPDVTLTIEPGTIIRFRQGTKLEIRGRLQAHGTAGDSIVITSVYASTGLNDWKGVQVGVNGSIDLDYCSMSNAVLLLDMRDALYGQHKVAHSCLSFNNQVLAKEGYGTSTPNMTLVNCVFERNFLVSARCIMIRFDSCTFRYNDRAIDHTYEQEILNCTFSDHTGQALGLAAGRIENCIFTRNGIGVNCWFSGKNYIFKNNTVTENGIGIILMGGQEGVKWTFSGNIICGNTNYNLKNGKALNFTLPDNCWCGSDSAEIRSKIFDGYSDPSLGLVNFMPLSTTAGPCAIPSDVPAAEKWLRLKPWLW